MTYMLLGFYIQTPNIIRTL